MIIRFELTKKIRLKFENIVTKYAALDFHKAVFTVYLLFLRIHFLYKRDRGMEALWKNIQ